MLSTTSSIVLLSKDTLLSVQYTRRATSMTMSIVTQLCNHQNWGIPRSKSSDCGVAQETTLWDACPRLAYGSIRWESASFRRSNDTLPSEVSVVAREFAQLICYSS